MKAYLTFTGKEFTESMRTYKLMILLVVFTLFGIMSPLFAKFTPEILKAAGIDPTVLGLAAPSAFDSFAQFFKNVGQMGLLVVVIVFCGLVANEFTKGTLINVLTKGMRRSTVIWAKFTSAITLWTVSFLVCLGVTYAYTAYYFSLDGLKNQFMTFFTMWLFGVFLLALIILGGVLFKTVYGSLLITGGIVIVLSLVNIFPKAQKYNPMLLSSGNMNLLAGKKSVADFTASIIICAALIVLSLVASIVVFNKKQL